MLAGADHTHHTGTFDAEWAPHDTWLAIRATNVNSEEGMAGGSWLWRPLALQRLQRSGQRLAIWLQPGAARDRHPELAGCAEGTPRPDWN